MTSEGAQQGLAPNGALPHHPAVYEHDRHAEVVKREERGIAVHVSLLGLDSELPEQPEGLVAEVATLASDELDVHQLRG